MRRTTLRLLIAGLGLLPAAPALAQTDFGTDRRESPAASIRLPTIPAQPEPLPLPVPVSPDTPAWKSSSTGSAADALFGTTLPIDLPTVLRLANAASPAVALAQVRVREALARVDQADAIRLPTLSAGAIYSRHDGIDQNRRAELFIISRQSLFAGGGASLRVDLADAIYQPLVARRLATAEAAAARADTNNALLEAVSAYFDLVQAHALLEINADILRLDEQILSAARSGQKQGMLRSEADVSRAETEVSLRRIERQELHARAAVASARLVRVLVLDPTVTLVPADPAAVPIDLFPPDIPVPALVEQALRNRPELAAAAARIEAADLRYRQARYGPLFPRVQANYLNGEFGGGKNGALSNLEGRGDLDAQLFWELRGLGFGNLADARLRGAERDRALVTAVAARAQVAAEVVSAARTARARRDSIAEARRAADQAQEMYRILSATSFGMIGPRRQFDALEPLLAVTSLSQARFQQLGTVVDYNRAQFQLLTAVGQPPDAAALPAAGCKP